MANRRTTNPSYHGDGRLDYGGGRGRGAASRTRTYGRAPPFGHRGGCAAGPGYGDLSENEDEAALRLLSARRQLSKPTLEDFLHPGAVKGSSLQSGGMPSRGGVSQKGELFMSYAPQLGGGTQSHKRPHVGSQGRGEATPTKVDKGQLPQLPTGVGEEAMAPEDDKERSEDEAYGSEMEEEEQNHEDRDSVSDRGGSSYEVEEDEGRKSVASSFHGSPKASQEAQATPFTFKTEDSRKRIKERRDGSGLDNKNMVQLFSDLDKDTCTLAELCKDSAFIRSEKSAIKVKLDSSAVLNCLQDSRKKSALLYFMGKVVANHQLYAWVEVAARPQAFSHFSYLGKGIYLGMCIEYASMYKLLEAAGVWGAGLFALILPWDPLFDPDKEFMKFCLVWITIKKFLAYLWPLASPLIEATGKVLHKPKMDLRMTPRNIRVCILWEMIKEIPDILEIDVGMADPLCMALHFSSFPHACYKSKQVGHFAKECVNSKPKSLDLAKEGDMSGEMKDSHTLKELNNERKIEIVIPIDADGAIKQEAGKPLDPTYDELLAKYRIHAILKKG